MIGKGPSARSIRLDLPRFTLIGATTRAGLLTSPRATVRHQLPAGAVRAEGPFDHPHALGEHPQDRVRPGRGARNREALPRHAPHRNRLIKRERDFAQVKAGGRITLPVAREALAVMEIDELGLDRIDRAMLQALIGKFGGGPVGLDTLAATTGEDATTIEDVYEPYLLQLGF